MKITAPKKVLADVLTAAVRGTSTRANLPVLYGVKITAGPEGVTLCATDLEQFVSVSSANFTTSKPGEVVVLGRLVESIVKKLPAGDVTLEANDSDGRVVISSGSARFSVVGLPVGDFPQVPKIGDSAVVEIEGQELADAISQAARAASSDEGRPILTGVLCAIEGDTMTMAATDSYRLTVRTLQVNAGGDSSVIIPGKLLHEVARHLGQQKVTLTLGEHQVGFDLGGTQIVSRLIEGKFPDYKQLIPSSYSHTLSGDRAKFTEAVGRMALVAKANTPVRLHLGEEVKLTATQTGVAEASETIDLSYDGDAMEVGFNPQFLLDGLGALQSDDFMLEFVDPGRPAMLQGAGAGEFQYLIMPVRLLT